jgi:hypothetical protein
MELSLTKILSPLSRATGFFFSELGVSATTIAFSSFIAAILSSLFFLFSFRFSYFPFGYP